MSNWPVKTYDAAVEREKLIPTHRPIPLPAYDIDGKLIAPDACRDALAGAIARVIFTLSHSFNDNSKDRSPSSNCFAADVQSVRVLIKPEVQSISSKKRKIALRDPMEHQTSKRTYKVCKNC
jgi:hypothetical protein